MQRLSLRLLHEASAGSVATVQFTGSTVVGWDAVGMQLGHRRQLQIFFSQSDWLCSWVMRLSVVFVGDASILFSFDLGI